MKMKILAVAVAFLVSTGSASAALIQWDVSGTFASGATASGIAVYDTTTMLFDNWSIDLTGDGTFAANTYSSAVAGSSQGVSDS